MSPEQARGKSVDRRTDVWAFACCFYEALTGSKAFHGETVTDTISAVVRAEPDFSKLPATLPSNVRHVMEFCFRKDRATRLRDIGDALLLLAESPAMPNASETTARRSRFPAWTMILATLVGALVVGWSASFLRPQAPARVSRFKISLPSGSLPFVTGNLALSYDGTFLAYVAKGATQRQVFIRHIDRLDSVPLDGAGDAHDILLSPDATTVAFFTSETNLTIKKINLDQLSTTEVGEGIGITSGAAWAPDGTIYFATSANGLQSLPPGSDTVIRVAPELLNEKVIHPSALPNSNWILVQLGGFVLGQEASIAAFSPATHELKTLVDDATNPLYAESGHLVFHRGGSLFAVVFDPERLETSGEPESILEGVHRDPFGGADFDIARDGSRQRQSGRYLGLRDRARSADAFHVRRYQLQSALVARRQFHCIAPSRMASLAICS